MLRSALLDRHERSTRDRILDAAKELFARRGYTGTSIRMIAERAGVTDPALYYYYPTKRALHDALLDPPYLDDMESSGGDLDTAIDWLIAMFMRYADNGDLVRLSLRELLSGDPAAMAFRRQAEAEYREAMGGFLRAQYGGAAETIQDIVTLMLSGVFWDAILRYGDRFEEVVHEEHFQQWLRDLIRTALPPSSGEWR